MSATATPKAEAIGTVPTCDNVGCLPIGTVLPSGDVIVDVSLTAYKVEWGGPHGAWVPFTKVHPQGPPATPLVVFE